MNTALRSIGIGAAAGLALMATIAACDTPDQPTPPPVVTDPALDVDPGPGVTVIDAPLTEDDPGWDCRTMGNHECGAQIQGGTWYVITFDDAGHPIGVRPR